MSMRILQPPGWKRPSGYSNGVSASGRLVFVAGQIGWDENEAMHSDDFVEQVRQALGNILAVLAEDGAGPEHVTRMTWYCTDKRDYLDRLADVGRVYREIMGKNFPAMTLVQISGLVEDGAKVEIEATAVVPEEDA